LTYDSSGRLKTVTTPDGKVASYAYDNSLMKRSRTDVNGNVTVQYFDALGRITSVVDAKAQAVTYGYDPLGYLTTVSTPDGPTAIAYDSLGRRTSISVPQLGTTTFTLDAVGNLISTGSNGKTVAYSYDPLNRVTSKQPLNEPPATFTYDQTVFTNGIGRLTTMSDAAGTVNYSYWPNGLVSASKRQVDGFSYTTAFAYDQVGRVTEVQYPDLSKVDYVWDGAILSTVTLNGSLVARWSSYDASGRPLSVTYGNGVATTFGYDAYSMGHLATLVTTSGATQLQNLSYDWYTLPNTGGINLGSVMDNRANKIVNGVNGDESQTFGYDALNRLTQATGVWGTKSFIYDAAGNPTTFGGLTSRTLNFTGNQVTSGTGLSNVTYDASGNLQRKTLDGIDWNFSWTIENRLAAVLKNGGQVASMTYDANGGRVKKVFTPPGGATVTTTYIGDLYEKRTYSDGSPDRHTINVLANGQLIASVTRTGSIVTALNGDAAWRLESVAASMYDPRTLRGGLLRAMHLARASLKHPAAGSVVWLLVFGVFA
jgi:YD repeat-containing protein